MTRVFRLDADGDAIHATLVKFDGWQLAAGLVEERPYKLPDPIYFEANSRALRTLDFVANDQGWPILSRRLREALASVGEFAHRAIPLVMLDEAVPQRFDAAGKLRPGVALYNFAAVQITSYTDALDPERQALADVPLPPLFRLRGLHRPLLVSDAGRLALERAAIRGVRLRPFTPIL